MASEFTVKIHPQLARAALAAGDERLYRAWVLLRASDPIGTGSFTLAEAISLLQDTLGQHRQTVERTLRDGDTRWWGIDRQTGRLWTRSLEKVCQTLRCKAGRPVAIPSTHATGKLKTWRAICATASFPHDKHSKPTSQQTIANRVGKSRRTIITYVKAAKLDVQRNVMASVRSSPLDYEERAAGWFESGGVAYKNLPCSYRSTLVSQRLNIGRAKMLSRPGGQKSRGRSQSPVRFIVGNTNRVFRALHSLAESHIAYVSPKNTTNAVVWEGYMKVDGRNWRM